MQRNTFRYFWEETNPENGLIPDHTSADDVPASIAGVGFALASYPVAVERGFVARAEGRRADAGHAALLLEGSARRRRQTQLVIGASSITSSMSRPAGRAWRCELSTIDTTILIAGALTAAAYFDRDTDAEREVRDARRLAVPTGGLAMGAKRRGHGVARMEAGKRLPTISVAGIQRGADPLRARPRLADAPLAREELSRVDVDLSLEEALRATNFCYGAPLFMHQLSHVWIDFRGIQDAFMRRQALDYFENSRRATYVNQQYGIRNPKGFSDYGQHAWGITASNGPGPTTRRVRGVDSALPWIRRSRRTKRSG